MKIIDLSDFSEIGTPPAGCIAALGNFDGVHLGHTALFEAARKSPLSAVFTFTNPAKPRESTLFLTDTAERLRLFSACGIQYAFLEDFERISNFTPEKFVGEYLKSTLKLSGTVCGENYHFGIGGAADAAALRTLCEKAGMSCTVVPFVKIAGKTVSSGAIREAVLSGKVELSRELLGHPFSVTARADKPRNALYDFTVSPRPGMVFPGEGVYCAAVTVSAAVFPAAVYAENGAAGVKIFGCGGDICGNEIRIEFLAKIRESNGSTQFAAPGATDENYENDKNDEDSEKCLRIFREYLK